MNLIDYFLLFFFLNFNLIWFEFEFKIFCLSFCFFQFDYSFSSLLFFLIFSSLSWSISLHLSFSIHHLNFWKIILNMFLFLLFLATKHIQLNKDKWFILAFKVYIHSSIYKKLCFPTRSEAKKLLVCCNHTSCR